MIEITYYLTLIKVKTGFFYVLDAIRIAGVKVHFLFSYSFNGVLTNKELNVKYLNNFFLFK